MSEHRATICWDRVGSALEFTQGTYSREHTWTFDGGAVIQASPSPSVVPVPFSNPSFVDPEEAFVAAVSSCHMLTYLYLASRRGFQLERYWDQAVGQMTKNDHGVPWVSHIVLHPSISYVGEGLPTPEIEAQLHREAHEQCFIANSIKTLVTIGQAGGAAVPPLDQSRPATSSR